MIKFSYDSRDNRSDLKIYRRSVFIKPAILCRVRCFPRQGLDPYKNSFLLCDTTTFWTVLLEALNTHSVGRVFGIRKTYTQYELVWHKNRDQERMRKRGIQFCFREKNRILVLQPFANFSYL